jgi:hypothetical protein
MGMPGELGVPNLVWMPIQVAWTSVVVWLTYRWFLRTWQPNYCFLLVWCLIAPCLHSICLPGYGSFLSFLLIPAGFVSLTLFIVWLHSQKEPVSDREFNRAFFAWVSILNFTAFGLETFFGFDPLPYQPGVPNETN